MKPYLSIRSYYCDFLGTNNIPPPSRDDDSENVLGLKLKGPDTAVRKFLKAILRLLGGKKPEDITLPLLAKKQVEFVQIVLDFFIDSHLIDAKSATKLGATFSKFFFFFEKLI